MQSEITVCDVPPEFMAVVFDRHFFLLLMNAPRRPLLPASSGQKKRSDQSAGSLQAGHRKTVSLTALNDPELRARLPATVALAKDVLSRPIVAGTRPKTRGASEKQERTQDTAV